MVDMNEIKKSVLALDTNGKLLLFGGLVGVIACFLEWRGTSGDIPMMGKISQSGTGLLYGRLALIGLAVACGTFIHQTWGKVDDAKLKLYPKLQLGGAGLGALMAIWCWLATDSIEGSGGGFGTSYGMWLALLASLAATFGAFQAFKASQSQVSP
ncbi:MAG: hypothetical protein V2A76_13365 [Planctomycetota bacterium]